MTKYLITGGTRLKGTVVLRGAKNAGFKALIAALLGDSPSTINNLSEIGDVETTKEVIRSLGGEVEDSGDHSLRVFPQGLSSFDAPRSCGMKSRAATMFAGPLLAKFGQAILPLPGGDRIGSRPIDRHLAGLEALGAEISLKGKTFYIRAPHGLRGGSYRFPKNSHTGTETLIMAAVKARGKTILENAAAEPEVDNLIDFLNKAGAKIKRSEPRRLIIEGVSNLRGVNHEVMPDRNVAVTFACAALATRGDIFIEHADPTVLAAFREQVVKTGGGWEEAKGGLHIFWREPLKSTQVVTGPYPAFMTDWQSLWATLMTQAKGESLIHETVFENRFGYLANLRQMGAHTQLYNPEVSDPAELYNFNLENDRLENFHAVRIFGPSGLRGKEVTINDVRSGATMLLAGMIASGQTRITDETSQIDRGYEKLEENLVALGAKIERIAVV